MEFGSHDGKIERYQLWQTPCRMCALLFVVDREGRCIGRRVDEFTLVDKLAENYYYPAPDADQVHMDAYGKSFHLLFDCV